MYHLDKLRERMCEELEEVSECGRFGMPELELSHKLIASVNGIDCLMAHKKAHVERKEKDNDDFAWQEIDVERHPEHLSKADAESWVSRMKNSDGTVGAHWTFEQTQDVAKQRNINCNPNDFWAVMNMMYSDYCQVAKRQSVDTPGFYADMAKAFLDDADAADGKAYLYWDCIADK